jgi:phage anti-repressor protein
MPGHAGNFLTRLFSLSPETVPQVPVKILAESIRHPTVEPIIPRRKELYSFVDVLNQYNNWQEFHRDWPDFQNHDQFNYFIQLFQTKFSTIVYSIHPYELGLAEAALIDLENSEFYFVELDEKYHSWVKEQQAKLKFIYRPDFSGELNQFKNLKNKYSMTSSINLTSLLESETSFANEYLRVVANMNITPDLPGAIELYQGWIKTRNPWHD